MDPRPLTAWRSLEEYRTEQPDEPAEEVTTDGQDASPDAEADGDTVD